MISDIDVSVIVPVYNAAELLDRCLDSIFNQETDCTIEVILIDDGSTDNSVDLIRQRPEQDRIRLFQQTNSGPAKARNKGIAEARGKYLAFLDADDYWLPMFISRTASFLDAHEDVVAVSVGQRHLTWGGNHVSPRLLNTKPTEFAEPLVIDDFFEFWAENNHICTGSITLRTQIAKKIGGMREELRQCEDLEFWAILGSQGKMGFVPEILFVSDGTKIAINQGWISKMQKRWDNTPSIDDWLKRIIKSEDPIMSQNLTKILTHVSLPLIYDKLLTKRWRYARQEAMQYGHYLPYCLASRVINVAKYSGITWWLLRMYIRYKEFHRK